MTSIMQSSDKFHKIGRLNLESQPLHVAGAPVSSLFTGRTSEDAIGLQNLFSFQHDAKASDLRLCCRMLASRMLRCTQTEVKEAIV